MMFTSAPLFLIFFVTLIFRKFCKVDVNENKAEIPKPALDGDPGTEKGKTKENISSEFIDSKNKEAKDTLGETETCKSNKR